MQITNLMARVTVVTAVVCIALLAAAQVAGSTRHVREIAYIFNSQIRVLDINRGFTAPLTAPDTYSYNPAWSPDGQWIAFEAANENGYALYVMDAVGRQRRQLTPSRGGSAAWSPDGTQIAFHSEIDGNYEIYTINVDGSDMQRLTNNEFSDLNPAWSPEGTHILFQSARSYRSAIYSMDMDGGREKLLTNTEFHSLDPAWSPDGRHIVFLSTQLNYQTLHVADDDGSNIRLLFDSTAYDGSPVWTDDYIIFDSDRYRDGYYFGWGIYIVNADGSDMQFLTQGVRPSWRP